MDEAEMKLEHADPRHPTREYLWFAITLLCIMAFIVVQTNT